MQTGTQPLPSAAPTVILLAVSSGTVDDVDSGARITVGVLVGTVHYRVVVDREQSVEYS